MIPPFSVELVTEEPDISPLQDSWERLYRASSSEPSTSYEWTDAMTRSHLKDGDRFILLRVALGEDPVALVPLVASPHKKFGCTIVTLRPISEAYNTHSDILASKLSEEAVDALVEALFSLPVRWDVFQMAKILEDSPLLRHLESSLIRRRSAFEWHYGHASYFLSLPASYPLYLASRSAKFRSHLKRTEKKIHGAGTTRVVEFSASGEFDHAYDMLLRVERASWKHAHGTAISAVSRQTGFYRDMGAGAAAHGRLHLQFLILNGEPIAYNLGHIRGGSYAYLKTSYDERFKPLGPATYLRAHLVRTLIERGVQSVDFPAEPYEWERQWTESVRWHKSVTVYNRTSAARVLAWIDRFRRRSQGLPTIEHWDPLESRPRRA